MAAQIAVGLRAVFGHELVKAGEPCRVNRLALE